MLCGFDTRDVSAVEREIMDGFQSLFKGADPSFIPRAFALAKSSFYGEQPGYFAIDAAYHDFEHTLQGTLCLFRLLQGRAQAGVQPALSSRWFELTLLSILFHDSGYLRTTEEREGTGARFTQTHVSRSECFIAKLLGPEGYSPAEIQAMQRMVRCTELNIDLGRIPFASELERQLGFALATADLLAQMAADDYVDKLPALFAELEESYRIALPAPKSGPRFSSAQDLRDKTPDFWTFYVLPKINKDFLGVYRYLNRPFPDGPNPFLKSIEANIKRAAAGRD